MATFVKGQRWINENELERGLGTLLKAEKRKVTLFFPSTGETRIYQLENTPLHRMIFSKGDQINDHDGQSMTISGMREENQLIIYTGLNDETGQPCEMSESVIEGKMTFSRPGERILASQLSKNNEFNLRYKTLEHYQRLCGSSLLGLCGSRISLVPHQLHIAHEAGSRFSPRVLLADEAGLGKTIEAGLILNRQLLTGRISRVLVIVPESLTHQWLVEMLRRFNLHFTLFNKEQYQARCDEGNPFDSAQLVLVSLQFLCADQSRMDNALKSDWDMLIVDEAHHLKWQDDSDKSSEYCFIEKLSRQTRAMLLLTATPEQLGLEGHFARLKLLDPACFHSLDNFLEQEANYLSVVRLADSLKTGQEIDASAKSVLHEILGESYEDMISDTESDDAEIRTMSRRRVLDALCDRYGISRVLFRNRRDHIGGFPGRVVQGYALETPELYQIALKSPKEKTAPLTPEVLYQSAIVSEVSDTDPWWMVDPRAEWLDHMARLVKEKILIICANASTAIDLENSLRISGGHHAAVFHENMSIIERDRAAAWFMEEHGAHLLICSEIGSEGRNFQSAHHLVLFDLPFNPDLLEQRIGRLDRIGQKEVIKIHVPYLKDTAQENLFHWYDKGLNAFERYCASAGKVFTEQKETLSAWVFDSDGSDASFLENTQKRVNQLNRSLEEGRDVLLEIASSGENDGDTLRNAIIEQESTGKIRSFSEQLFICFGIDTEDYDENSLILHPGNHMRVSSYPGLAADSITVTFDRDTALGREDMTFASWEHPLVREGMELLLGSDIGNTAVALLKSRSLPEGTMLLEAIFVAEPAINKHFPLNSFMPPTLIHTLVDPAFNNLSDKIQVASFHSQLRKVKNSQAKNLIRVKRESIANMIEKAEDHAKVSLSRIVRQASARFIETMKKEIHRLATLKTVNPNIREDEIQFLVDLAAQGHTSLEKASLKLDSVRIVLTMN